MSESSHNTPTVSWQCPPGCPCHFDASTETTTLLVHVCSANDLLSPDEIDGSLTPLDGLTPAPMSPTRHVDRRGGVVLTFADVLTGWYQVAVVRTKTSSASPTDIGEARVQVVKLLTPGGEEPPQHVTIQLESAFRRLSLFDRQAHPLPHARFRVTINTTVIDGEADFRGCARLPELESSTECEVEWRPAGNDAQGTPPVFDFKRRIFIDVDSGDDHDKVHRRLHNFGYNVQPGLENAVRAFQFDQGLTPSGDPDDATMREVLFALYEQGRPERWPAYRAPQPVKPSLADGEDGDIQYVHAFAAPRPAPALLRPMILAQLAPVTSVAAPQPRAGGRGPPVPMANNEAFTEDEFALPTKLPLTAQSLHQNRFDNSGTAQLSRLALPNPLYDSAACEFPTDPQGASITGVEWYYVYASETSLSSSPIFITLFFTASNDELFRFGLRSCVERIQQERDAAKMAPMPRVLIMIPGLQAPNGRNLGRGISKAQVDALLATIPGLSGKPFEIDILAAYSRGHVGLNATIVNTTPKGKKTGTQLPLENVRRLIYYDNLELKSQLPAALKQITILTSSKANVVVYDVTRSENNADAGPSAVAQLQGLLGNRKDSVTFISFLEAGKRSSRYFALEHRSV